MSPRPDDIDGRANGFHPPSEEELDELQREAEEALLGLADNAEGIRRELADEEAEIALQVVIQALEERLGCHLRDVVVLTSDRAESLWDLIFGAGE